VLRLDVPIALEALEAAQECIEAHLLAAGTPQPVILRVRLVVEELLANLVMHARFAGNPPPARVLVAAEAAGVSVTIEDAAAPFDPRTAAPRPAHDLADPPIGGLGLLMVRRSAEIRDYAPIEGGWNRTELWLPTGSVAG
jgi:anti-sigma regulatory factor (Ser/Thr protein kinase)